MRTQEDMAIERVVTEVLGDIVSCVIMPSNYANPPDYITVCLEFGERLTYDRLRNLSGLLHTQDIALVTEGEEDYGDDSTPPRMWLEVRGWSFP